MNLPSDWITGASPRSTERMVPGMMRFQFRSPPPKMLGSRSIAGRRAVGGGVALGDHLRAGFADIVRVPGQQRHLLV